MEYPLCASMKLPWCLIVVFRGGGEGGLVVCGNCGSGAGGGHVLLSGRCQTQHGYDCCIMKGGTALISVI